MFSLICFVDHYNTTFLKSHNSKQTTLIPHTGPSYFYPTFVYSYIHNLSPTPVLLSPICHSTSTITIVSNFFHLISFETNISNPPSTNNLNHSILYSYNTILSLCTLALHTKNYVPTLSLFQQTQHRMPHPPPTEP
jgi:hypothetical protein